jgi:hypothetical protein
MHSHNLVANHEWRTFTYGVYNARVFVTKNARHWNLRMSSEESLQVGAATGGAGDTNSNLAGTRLWNRDLL